MNGVAHHRLWKFNRRELHQPARIAQRIVDVRVFQLGQRDDFTGAGFGDNFLRLTLNPQQLRNAFLATARDVHDVEVGFQRTGNHANIRQVTGKRVHRRFENKTRKRRIRFRFDRSTSHRRHRSVIRR